MTGSRRYEAFTEGGWSAVVTESDYQPIPANYFRAWCRNFFFIIIIIPTTSTYCWDVLVPSRCMEGLGSGPLPERRDEDRRRTQETWAEVDPRHGSTAASCSSCSSREEKIRTQSSGDLNSEIINKFTSSNIPIPGEPFKETSFLFLIPFTHHTARPFWHTSGLLQHCFEAVLTGAWNPIHGTAWPSEWDTALNI